MAENESNFPQQWASSNNQWMFLEIGGGLLPQPILLGNVYRPPWNNNDNDSIRRFNTELSSILNILTKSNLNIIISGDFNINLLEINERECYGEFLDLMITNELFRKISLPTRKCKTNVLKWIRLQMLCRNMYESTLVAKLWSIHLSQM